MFLLNDKQVVSRFDKFSFWDSYGTVITIVATIFAIVALIVILYIIGDREEKRKNRLVDYDGQKVDSLSLVTVTLTSYQKITLKKGDTFFAPIPQRDNYEFAGWFYDSAFSKPYLNKRIKTDLVLYPKWIKSS